MKLTGKIIVVTGAGSGIGRELVLQLCRRGAVVVGADYNEQTLAETQQLVQRERGQMSVHVLDVSQRDQVLALPQQVLAQHDRVDGLINNAGIIHTPGSIEALPPEQVERVFNVNWWGTYYMVKAFLPLLRQADEAVIVNVSSMGGFMPFPDQVAYGASKAAVKLLTEGLRAELKRDSRIRVSVVYPGAVITSITDNAPDISEHHKSVVRKLEEGKQIGVTAARAAARIICGLEHGSPRIVVGADSWLLDKLYRLMPNAAVSVTSWLMGKMMVRELVDLYKR